MSLKRIFPIQKINMINLIVSSVILCVILFSVFFFPQINSNNTLNLFSQSNLNDFELTFNNYPGINSSVVGGNFLLNNSVEWRETFDEFLNLGEKVPYFRNSNVFVSISVDMYPFYLNSNRSDYSGFYGIEKIPIIVMKNDSFNSILHKSNLFPNSEKNNFIFYNILGYGNRYLNFNKTITFIENSVYLTNNSIEIGSYVDLENYISPKDIPEKKINYFPSLFLDKSYLFGLITNFQGIENILNQFSKENLIVNNIKLEIDTFLNLQTSYDIDEISNPQYSIASEVTSIFLGRIKNIFEKVGLENPYIQSSVTNNVYLKLSRLKLANTSITIALFIFWIGGLILCINLYIQAIKRFYKSPFWIHFWSTLKFAGLKPNEFSSLSMKLFGFMNIFLPIFSWIILINLSKIQGINLFYSFLLVYAIPVSIYLLIDFYYFKKRNSIFKTPILESEKDNFIFHNNNLFLKISVFLFGIALSFLIFNPKNIIDYSNKLTLKIFYQFIELSLFVVSSLVFMYYFKSMINFSLKKLFDFIEWKTKDKYYSFFYIAVCRNKKLWKNIDYSLIFTAILIFSGIFLVEMQHSTLIYEENTNIGADIEIKIDFADLDQILNYESKLSSKLKGYDFKITPFFESLVDLSYYENESGKLFSSKVAILVINFAIMQNFESYSDEKFEFSFNLSDNSVFCFNSYDFNERIIHSTNTTAFELSFPILGTSDLELPDERKITFNTLNSYSNAPRILTNPFDTPVTMIIDYKSLMNSSKENLLFKDSYDQGFLLYFPKNDKNDIIEINNILKREFETNLSPKITGNLSNFNDLYFQGFRRLIYLITILLIILIVIIKFTKNLDIMESLKSIYIGFFYQNIPKNKIKISLLIFLFSYNNILIFISLAIAFGFALCLNIVLSFYFGISSRFLIPTSLFPIDLALIVMLIITIYGYFDFSNLKQLNFDKNFTFSEEDN